MEVFEMPRSLERFEFGLKSNHIGYLAILSMLAKTIDGNILKIGQLSLSRSKLSEISGLTESQIRNIEVDLELSGFISILNQKNRASIITVCHLSYGGDIKKTASKSQVEDVENKKESSKIEKHNSKQTTDESQTNRRRKSSDLAPVIAPVEYVPPSGEATPDKVLCMWNKFAELCSLSQVKFLNEDRKKRLLEACEVIKEMEEWRGVLDIIQDDDFLMGRMAGKNFKCSFDWLMQFKPNTRTKNYIIKYEEFLAIKTKKVAIP